MRDIDEIIRRVINICPTVKVRELEVSHPGTDDDGLWFFQEPCGKFEVQIESSEGTCPFLIETDESVTRVTTKSIDETVETLIGLLHLHEP